MFFVVSTGRSGSRTVAEVLAQSPSCECRHEPFPQLIAEAPRFLYGELAQGDLVRLLRETRSPTVDGKIYGESSNKLSLIIPALVEAFPGSQFLWLVRDGRDFVCSGLQRGWYEPGEETESAGDWQRWRLRGDRSGDIAPDAWRAMDRFERVCWLWSFTNRLIEQELVRHGPEHYRVVTIERLGAALPDLCDFLGLEPVSFVVGRANRRVVRGVADEAVAGSTNLVDAVQTWTDWTAEQREIFTRWCGPLMDRHYPGWRSDDGQWLAVPGEVDAAGHPISPSGSLTLQGDGDDLGSVLRSLVADVAEIKQMRSQLRSLTRAHERHLKDSAAELGELRRSHGKTLSREELDAQRRLHEYEVRDLKAEHERQIRDVERKLAGAGAAGRRRPAARVGEEGAPGAEGKRVVPIGSRGGASGEVTRVGAAVHAAPTAAAWSGEAARCIWLVPVSRRRRGGTFRGRRFRGRAGRHAAAARRGSQ